MKEKIKKFVKMLFKIIILVGIIILGYYIYSNYLKKTYDTYSATKGDYNEIINVKGTIDTINSAEVYSKSTNVISQILVKEGDIVKSGDILAYLDNDKNKQLESAKLNYEEAKRSFEITEKLYNIGDTSKDNYMKMKNVMELAKVSLDSIEIEDDLVIKAPIAGIVTKVEAKIGMVAGGIIPKRLFYIDDISKLRIKVLFFDSLIHK